MKDELPAGRKKGTSAVPAIAVLAIAAIAAAGWYGFREAELTPPRPIAIRYLDSVAVMPFENLTGDAAYDHVGVGITEEIIAHLARIPPLKVISRHSVQAVSQQELTVPQLGNALNVRHIIEGSIRLVDNKLSVSLQYIDAEEDTRIWTDEVDGSIEDVVSVQENVALYAANKIVENIPGLSLPQLSLHREFGPGQEAYLNGKRWLGQRTPEGMMNAITFFQRAIDLDPRYAPAYADLSSAYALSMFYRYDVGIDSYTLAAQALAFAEHAIALDPNLAAAYAARGYLGALIGQSAAAVAADFDRAASLQPNAASIPSWRARSLAQRGQYEEAISEASRAIDLDPLAPGRHIALGELSLQLGDYEQAISSALLATALEPRIFRTRAIEARALLLNGNPQRCANLSLGPHRVLRATCLKVSGRSDEADEIIDSTLEDIRNKRLRVDGATDVVVFEDLAVYFAYRGDAENALFWSARAYAASPVGLEIRVLESDLFERVREDQGFSRSISAIRADLYDRVRRDSADYF